MIIADHPVEVIIDVLETESDFVQIRLRSRAHIFQTSGKFSPAVGLKSTLIGLVSMIRVLEGGDEIATRQLGQGIAVVLLTTFFM